MMRRRHLWAGVLAILVGCSKQDVEPDGCPSDTTNQQWWAIDKQAAPLLEAFDAIYVGDSSRRVIYLTFDIDFGSPDNAKILDTLKAEGAHATFFVTTRFATVSPFVLKRMTDEGHLVANHTEAHQAMSPMPRWRIANELSSVERAVVAATGRPVARYLRPPYGRYSKRSLCTTARLGYKTVLWSVAYRDFDPIQPTITEAFDKLVQASHPGAIYLLHASSTTTTAVLPRVIAALRAEGYELRTLEGL